VKIYVTGATGMVGRNIVESPLFKDFQLLTPGRSEVDLFNYQSVFEFIKKHQPDFIIHCAGRVGGIQANMANPVAFLVENIDIGRNLVMAAKNAGVKKLINLSSSCMYPRNAENPLHEDLILKGELEPTNEGYAIGKIMAQRLCVYIHQEDSSYQYKTLIPSNLYGRFDKFDVKSSHLIPAVIRKIHHAKKNNLSEVDIWGDGTARREFMYAQDLVDCLQKAILSFESVPYLMNVGLGFDYSINEYYQAAAQVIGYQGRFVHDVSKPVGMKQKLTAVDKVSKWGWKSKTTLHEGLEKTYRYYLSLNED